MKKNMRALMIVLSIASIASIASADYVSEVTATSGLINYWQFNETSGTTAFDSVGSDNATYDGAATLGTAGPRAVDGFAGMTSGNLAPTYDPTEATTSSTADDFLAGGVSAITVSLWYKLDAAGSDATRQILFGYQESAGARYNFLATREITGGLKVYLKDAEGDQFHWNIVDTAYNTAATDSEWHNFVFSWDGTQLAAYLDGGNKKTGILGGVSGNIASTSESLVIGGDIIDANGMDGQIDEVAVFNTVLSDSTVSSLYSSAIPEPATLSMIGIAAALFLGFRRLMM